MRHLFSPQGEAALATTMALRPLLAFDFDGTLAPIVDRPEAARVPPPVARRLERLAALLPVAIITGRAVVDVRERLGFVPRFIVGSHGAEGHDAADEAGIAVFDALRVRLHESADELARAGIGVEDKRYSLALHYRLAVDHAGALATIARLLDGLGPALSSHGGKCVVNVVATHAPDKAQALAGLVERCSATGAVFAGDDVNDEPVFARDEPTWLTVRVGLDNPDTRAQFCIASAHEMAVMLDRMLSLAGAPQS